MIENFIYTLTLIIGIEDAKSYANRGPALSRKTAGNLARELERCLGV